MCESYSRPFARSKVEALSHSELAEHDKIPSPHKPGIVSNSDSLSASISLRYRFGFLVRITLNIQRAKAKSLNSATAVNQSTLDSIY